MAGTASELDLPFLWHHCVCIAVPPSLLLKGTVIPATDETEQMEMLEFENEEK